MGRITSAINWTGYTMPNGTILGEPAVEEDGSFVWDGDVPDGTLNDRGELVSAIVGSFVGVSGQPAPDPSVPEEFVPVPE